MLHFCDNLQSVIIREERAARRSGHPAVYLIVIIMCEV